MKSTKKERKLSPEEKKIRAEKIKAETEADIKKKNDEKRNKKDETDYKKNALKNKKENNQNQQNNSEVITEIKTENNENQNNNPDYNNQINKKIEESLSNESVYSYHTFYFPFVYESIESTPKNSFNYHQMVDLFRNNRNWESIDQKDENKISKNPDIRNDEDKRLYYKEYQYFHPHVRRALYGFGSGIVHNFEFMPEAINNKAHYIIEKSAEAYVLRFNAVKLKIYNTGIAILILECENRVTSQANMKAVKSINEYGRRINAPFLPDESDGMTLCADKLSIVIPGDKPVEFVSHFRNEFSSMFTDDKINTDKISLTHIADFIKDLLFYSDDCRYCFTSKKEKSFIRSLYKVIYIYPAIDDRMFVSCVVCDDTYINIIKFSNSLCDSLKVDINEKYAFETDYDVMKSLYEFIFIDPPGSCTCPNAEEIRKHLNESIYRRWIYPNSGNDARLCTLSAVTQHSFVSIMNQKETDYLIKNHLMLYGQMISLVLAQRATIVFLQHCACKLTEGIESKGNNIDSKRIKDLMNLQEKYIAYQNQLQFYEVTPQDQGIELYDMLIDSLYIEKEKNQLEAHLNNLYEATNINQDFVFNKNAFIIAIIALLMSLFGYVNDIFKVNFKSIGINIKKFILIVINGVLNVLNIEISSEIIKKSNITAILVLFSELAIIVFVWFVINKHLSRKKATAERNINKKRQRQQNLTTGKS